MGIHHKHAAQIREINKRQEMHAAIILNHEERLSQVERDMAVARRSRMEEQQRRNRERV